MTIEELKAIKIVAERGLNNLITGVLNEVRKNTGCFVESVSVNIVSIKDNTEKTTGQIIDTTVRIEL